MEEEEASGAAICKALLLKEVRVPELSTHTLREIDRRNIPPPLPTVEREGESNPREICIV